MVHFVNSALERTLFILEKREVIRLSNGKKTVLRIGVSYLSSSLRKHCPLAVVTDDKSFTSPLKLRGSMRVRYQV